MYRSYELAYVLVCINNLKSSLTGHAGKREGRMMVAGRVEPQVLCAAVPASRPLKFGLHSGREVRRVLLLTAASRQQAGRMEERRRGPAGVSRR